MDTQIDRPSRFLNWAQDTFGDIALNPAERTMRFVEEAVELAFACNMPRETVEKIVARVYERHQGNIELEAAQCQVTLELLAICFGYVRRQRAIPSTGKDPCQLRRSRSG